MPRRRKPEPSLAAVLVGVALIAVAFIGLKTGLFNYAAKLWVDDVRQDMQRVTDKQLEKAEQRNEQLREQRRQRAE
jgi:hypothetical protein